MSVSERVSQWIAQTYPKPTIDPEWLSECCDWISSEHNLSPSTHFHRFIEHVEAQLLQSNLGDSTAPGTGIDPRIVPPPPAVPNLTRARVGRGRGQRQHPGQGSRRQKQTTGPTPLLVEIRSITDIANSAFSLLNTHQTRLDRADLGLAQGDANPNGEQQQQIDEEDEGPIPRFPRGMLRFELSDGCTTFRAIEFRSLPELELGVTPLGYKMLLKSTPIRNGIAFLEPSNVTLKGFSTEDHDVHSEQVFVRSLTRRLGFPGIQILHPEQGQGLKSR
ncbi:hypothetical protein BS17DRAFT_118080 [Gyrodon lividus]|nr:hypothetical protein BS17DRAFT_118080 [Gyrodon lividus]